MNLVLGIIKILYMKLGAIIFNESSMHGDIRNFFSMYLISTQLVHLKFAHILMEKIYIIIWHISLYIIHMYMYLISNSVLIQVPIGAVHVCVNDILTFSLEWERFDVFSTYHSHDLRLYVELSIRLRNASSFASHFLNLYSFCIFKCKNCIIVDPQGCKSPGGGKYIDKHM